MAINKIEIQDSDGNIYYPHTDASVVKIGDSTVEDMLEQINIIQTAGGSATAITLTNVNLVNGFTISFLVAANNNGAATTINGKNLYKFGGTAAPALTAGKVVTVWYNGTSFFIKASAEGDAVAANVLAGKKFSNDSDTGITGTMTDRGAVTITPGTTDQVIAAGYHNGSGKVIGDTDLVSANIKAGVNIFGVAGNANVVDTSAGDAGAGDILSGKKAYVDGALVTGNIPVNPGLISGSAHIASAGAVVGNYSPDGINRIYLRPGLANTRQCIDGDMFITVQAPDLLPQNILSGKNILGIAGAAISGKRFASGQINLSSATLVQCRSFHYNYNTYYMIPISNLGLTFVPKIVMFRNSGSSSVYVGVYFSEGIFTDAGNGIVYQTAFNNDYCRGTGDYYNGYIPVWNNSLFDWYAWE